MSTITIQSIELVNFMCHGNLKIHFEKSITCIGGRNGSGKSAIMIALGILFGQRAHALERGNSYASLIKSGAVQATIRVTINNYLRFKPDVYGEKIVIEKRLRDKTAKVSIYNSLGKVFNIRKNELESIIERYSLKFDNPLNFLTQEKSKRFLNVTRPEDLYEFYYVGTEFKAIEEELKEGEVILQSMRDMVAETSQSLEATESKLSAERKNLNFLAFDAAKAMRELETEEKWTDVRNLENEIEDITVKIEEYDKSLMSKKEERDKLGSIMTEKMEDECVKDLEDEISKLKVQHHDVAEELADYISNRTRVREQIEVIRNRSNRDGLEAEISARMSELAVRKAQQSTLEAQRSEAYEAFQRERQENEASEAQRQNLMRQLSYLKKNAHDSHKQAQLESFKKIDQELQGIAFRDRVIGPVCRHVKLKDSKWFKTASMILKKTLTNYIVFNSEDKMKLHNLFKRLNIDYSVTQVLSKKPYENIRSNPDYTTLLSILAIDEPLVSNQLITLNNIEQIILIEDRPMAHRVIKSSPRNVDCAYTLTGDKIKMNNGSLSDFRQRDDGIYWFEDKESKVRKLEHEISQISSRDSARQRYGGLTDALGRLEVEMDGLEKRIAHSKIELDSLKEVKEDDVEGMEKKYSVLSRSVASLEKRKQDIECRISSIDADRSRILEKNRKARDEVERKKELAGARESKVSYEILSLENYKSKLIGEKRMKNEMISVAVRDLGERPASIRSRDEIAREKRGIHEFKAQAKNMESKETIAMTVSKMEKDLLHLRTIIKKFEETIGETASACERRQNKRDEIKDKDAVEAIRQFKEYTMRSGYEGEMVMDHENKRLDLRMKVHNSMISGSRSTLSGGERSFAGVCFLLSMWKCFKCPVKVLDEFDVFMDSLNRKMAIQSLFEFFKESGIQVILITPLDTSDLIDAECDIKILKKAGE